MNVASMPSPYLQTVSIAQSSVRSEFNTHLSSVRSGFDGVLDQMTNHPHKFLASAFHAQADSFNL
jgi:hypothetical protein